MKRLSKVLMFNLAIASISMSCSSTSIQGKSTIQEIEKTAELNTLQSFKAKQIAEYTNLLKFKTNKEEFNKDAKALFMKDTLTEQDVRKFLKSHNDFENAVSQNTILRLRKFHATLSLDQKRKLVDYFQNLHAKRERTKQILLTSRL